MTEQNPKTVPGIGVCRSCDAATVPEGCWGSPIEGEACLGCGAQVYELLRRKGNRANVMSSDQSRTTSRWVRRIKSWNGPPTDGRPWVADVRTFDIPETIAACIRNAALGMVAISLSRLGGSEMIRAAEQAAAERGVRVLWWTGPHDPTELAGTPAMNETTLCTVCGDEREIGCEGEDCPLHRFKVARCEAVNSHAWASGEECRNRPIMQIDGLWVCRIHGKQMRSDLFEDALLRICNLSSRLSKSECASNITPAAQACSIALTVLVRAGIVPASDPYFERERQRLQQ